MRETYYAGAYWGCRPESAEECARRAETFFHLLSACHPSYARWYEKHNSTKRALQLQFEPTFDTFVRFFGKKKYQMGKDGFYLGTWTGHVEQDQGGMVMLRCGSSAEVAPNSVLLHFPYEDPGKERLFTLPVLTGVMRAMALAWEPDVGVIVSGQFRDQMRQEEDRREFAGWLLYLSRDRGEVPSLPPPVRVEQVGDKGTIVILTPERLTASSPEHLALGRHVQELLDEKNLLRPVLPLQPSQNS
ncbi:MAG TPA: Imm52 family immunity protein [Myxococcaceae bacterium]|nr:Imm52 family immunity protein [Myxococcaceae bacterium]